MAATSTHTKAIKDGLERVLALPFTPFEREQVIILIKEGGILLDKLHYIESDEDLIEVIRLFFPDGKRRKSTVADAKNVDIEASVEVLAQNPPVEQFSEFGQSLRKRRVKTVFATPI